MSVCVYIVYIIYIYIYIYVYIYVYIKVEKLESQISVLEIDMNKQDQYNKRNNLVIHGIPDSVPDDQLEEKFIEIFNQKHF